MQVMKLTVLVILSSIQQHISTVKGCSCMWGTHKQSEFCAASFAIKAEVKNVTEEATPYGYVLYKHYTLNVLRVYKEHENIPIGQEAKVRTGGDGAMCGISLRANVTYFITGSVWDNVMSMSSCGWISSFDRLTKSQVHGIEHDYGENCDCAAQIQPGMMLGSSGPCGYGTEKPYEYNCYYNNAFCRQLGPAKCAWQIDDKAAPCKKRQRKLMKIISKS